MATTTVPRPEYPRPQFRREEWLCLNGEWQFEIDQGDSGEERGLVDEALQSRIMVPFCPESALSGVGCTDFLNAVWYRREIDVPAHWEGRDLLVHFQAVDYEATVWVNGKEVARHSGGSVPFTCDLGEITGERHYVIVVRARDAQDQLKPSGKQAVIYKNSGCRYTRTTGIWQSVWMEPVYTISLQRPRITPLPAEGAFRVAVPLRGQAKGARLKATLIDGEAPIAESEVAADAMMTPELTLTIPGDKVNLWAPGNPHLYDIELSLYDDAGKLCDRAKSYAGLRGVSLSGKGFYINGKPIFQRLVLDQGYYPEGIMTAPSDEALKKDIELSMQAGFNGARLHQKVFEERFLYHADKMGYLVWGEFADWHVEPKYRGIRGGTPLCFITEWLEAVERDYSHPCIIGWCPLNETHAPGFGMARSEHSLFVESMFQATKAADATRPVIDTSGFVHRYEKTDVMDSHNYTQDAERLAEQIKGLAREQPFMNNPDKSVTYKGQPYFVSEFGGIWWNPKARPGEASWGYGDRPESLDEFYRRLEGLCKALLDNPDMFGFCYTQLTDVFQEQNGIYGFDRSVKFDMERVRKAIQAEAAYEEKYR